MSHGPAERTTSAGNAKDVVARQNAGTDKQSFVSEKTQSRCHKQALRRRPQSELVLSQALMTRLQDVDASKSVSVNFETEENLELRLTPKCSESSIESPSCLRRRKTPPLGYSVLKSSRQKPETVTTKPLLDQESKPSLLSRLDLSSSEMIVIPDLKEKKKKDQQKDLSYMNPTCLGSAEPLMGREPIHTLTKQSNPFEPLTKMSKRANSTSASPLERQTTYPLHSGSTSSKVNPSTLTKSCLLSTGLQLLRNGRLELERQTLLLGQLKRQGRF
jgi:hypothetical protein